MLTILTKTSCVNGDTYMSLHKLVEAMNVRILVIEINSKVGMIHVVEGIFYD